MGRGGQNNWGRQEIFLVLGACSLVVGLAGW